MFGPKLDRRRAPARRTAVPGVLSLLALAACGGEAGPDSMPPSVIVISLDTVRADNLSCYGGPSGATPNIDRFSAGARRYRTCVAASPWTMPTHASMFTGLFPLEHGAHSFLPGPGHRGDNVFALSPRFETLAEALEARGYATAGIVSNSVYLRPGLGLEQGFETWQVKRDPGARVTERALAWIDESRSPERPMLLFVNYMDAHRPYATGAPGDRPREKLDALLESVMLRAEAPGELGVAVRGLHQKAVTGLDAEIGVLLDGLRERGLFDSSLIIVTSDHGEAFGEHGIVEHSKDVYEELVRVPLIVKEPFQQSGDVAATPASSIDLPGIVAAALPASGAVSIRAAFPRTPGAHVLLAENHYSRMHDLERFGERFHRQRRAAYDGPLKLIIDSRGAHELYDLAIDPGERNNLVAQRTEDVQRLLALDSAFAGEHRFEGDRVLPGALTGAQARDMGALGYGAGDGQEKVR